MAPVSIPARYELKYLLTPKQVDAVRDSIAGVCSLDRYSAAAARQRYTITSLYLDTGDLGFYRAHIDRAPRRLKLRVRRYDSENSPVFLEVKRRDDQMVLKTRAITSQHDWLARMQHPSDGDEALHDFSAVLERTHAEPRLLVRYQREAWASDVDEYARVTFDSALTFQAWEQLSLDGWDDGWTPIDDAATQESLRSLLVLELKFAGRAPPWMVSLVRRLDLLRRGFSKYVAGVDQVWGRRRAYDLWLKQPVFGAEP